MDASINGALGLATEPDKVSNGQDYMQPLLEQDSGYKYFRDDVKPGNLLHGPADLLAMEYPKMQGNISAARAKGFSDDEIRERLNEREALYLTNHGPEETNAFLGRTQKTEARRVDLMESAKLDSLSQSTGLTTDEVSKRLKEAKMAGVNASLFLTNDDVYSQLGGFLKEQNSIWEAGVDSFHKREAETAYAELGYDSMVSGKPVDAKRMEELRGVIDEYGKKYSTSFLQKTAGGAVDLWTQFYQGAKEAAPWFPAFVAGVTALNPAGWSNPVTAGANLAASISPAIVMGQFMNSFKQEGGALYLSLLEKSGPSGEKLDSTSARALAMTGGVINAFIEVGSMASVAALAPGLKIPGLKQWLSIPAPARDAVSKYVGEHGVASLVTIPTIREAILKRTGEFAKNVFDETSEEFWQEGTGAIAELIADRMLKNPGQSPAEIVERMFETAWESGKELAYGMWPGEALGWGGIAHSGISAALSKNARKTQLASQARFDAAKKLVGDAVVKVPEKSEQIPDKGFIPAPATAQEKARSQQEARGDEHIPDTVATNESIEGFIPEKTPEQPVTQTGEGTPVTPAQSAETAGVSVNEQLENTIKQPESVKDEAVFVAANKLQEFFQTLGDGGAQIAEELGVSKQEPLQETGEYVMKASSLSKVVQSHPEIMNHINADTRYGYSGLTNREALKALETRTQKRLENPDSQWSAEAREIRDQLFTDLQSAKDDTEANRVNAALYANMLLSRAERKYGKEGSESAKGRNIKELHRLDVERRNKWHEARVAKALYQSMLEPGDFDEAGNVRPAALREIEQEKNEIISAAQRGGTYMKAPNGRPSSLTGEHWALIRTKRFKNWFGDWDASWKKEAIRNQESVIVGHVTGKAAELLDQYTNKAPGVRTAIKSYALSVLPREVHTRALGKVFISGSSIKDTLSHSRGVMKFESLFCIDKLLSSAVEVGTEKIEKGITTHVLARKTLWNDEEFVVVMAVNEDQNGNRFYDHEMTEIKKLDELSTAPAVNGKVGGSEKAHRSLLSILREDVWNVNDFSQVVDENGEPLVVYHGTGTSDITEFKTSKATDKVGRLMALGEGKGKFYFTSNEQGARLAGEGAVARGQGRDAAVMPVFLNLRNPMPLQEYRSRYQSMTGHGLNEGYADGYTMQDRDKAIAALDRQIKKEGYDGIFDPAQNYYVAFNSDQIKSVENRGTFDGSNAHIFYQIIGERGAQALDKAQEVSTRMDNLAVARQMETAGKDAKAVWLASGWQRGKDGKWRYEIADGKWKVEAFDDKNVVKPLGVKNWRMTLGDIYNAPELYQAYPELKNVDVNITQMRDGTLGLSHGRSITLSETLFPVKNGAEIEARLADFMASEPWIEYQKALDDALELDDPDEANEIVNKLDDEWENSPIGYAMAKLFKKQQVLEPSQKAMEVLVHEVQHSVQRLEGLANGASVFEGRVRFEAEEEILATYVGEAWTEAVAHVEEIKARRSEAKARRQAWKREHRTTPLMAQSRGDAEAFKQWQNLDAEVKRLDDAYFKADEELHNKKSEILKLYDREVRESAFKKYQSVGGEVEARNASKRLSLSEAERKLSALSATEDVAREDQIILESALNGARQAMNFGQSAAVMEYERRLERDSAAWEKNVDAFTSKKLSRKIRDIPVMSMPMVLTLTGAKLNSRLEPKQIITSRAVLSKILIDKHGQEMDASILKQLPKALADPVMVFQSDTRPGDSVVVMLELKDRNGSAVIAPVLLESDSHNPDSPAVLTSLYDQAKGTPGTRRPNNQWFINQINKGNLLYIDTKKAPRWFSNSGLQLPMGLRTQQGVYKRSINSQDGFVNNGAKKSTAWAILGGLQLPSERIASGVYAGIIKTDADLVKLREQGNNTFYQSAATDPLVSVHKISEESLLKAAALGGLPVPSIGITKAESPFHGFGGISLIGTRDMVNPSEVPVYSRDAYTTRFPATVWDKVPVKKQATFMKAFRPAFEKVGDLSFLSSLMYVVENEPDRDRAMREFARSEGAKAAFLESKGVAVEPVMRAAQERSTGSMSPELQALVKSDSDKQYFVGGDEMHRKVSEAYYAAMEREGIKGRAKDKNGLMSYVYASTLFNDAVADSERIGTQEIDSYATRDKLNRLVKEFDDRDYKAFVAEKISALFGEPKVQVGRKKMSFTLENVVAAMKKQAGVGKEETLAFGAGNVRARLSKRFNSMEDMTAARDQVVSPEDALATDTASNDAMTAFRDVAVGQYDYADSWSAMDDAMRSLADAVKKKPTEANLRAAMKKHGFSNPSAGAIELGLKALTALRGVVTDYFEAKPERAVGLNEFVGAVAPESISPEALKVLQDAGLEVQTYKEGDGAQEAATTELSRSLASTNPNVFFQPAWHDSPLVREGVTRKPDGAKAKVVHLEASAFPALQGKSTKEILVWIKDILRQGGDVKILSTGQTARFTVTNIKASLKRGRESLHNEAYAALREMVSLAEYDHFEPADIKHVTRTAGQDVYYSALEIMGQLYSVRLKMDVVTEEIRQRNATAGIQPEDVRYKDHKLTEIEIAPALFHGMPDNGVPMQNADAISTVSLGILRGNVKPSAYDGAHLSQERRGQISLLSDGSVVISLFEKADRSTFVHEMGHMMLEDLIEDGMAGDASEQVRSDSRIAMEYLGISDMDLSRRDRFSGVEQARYRDAQERWARSFEAYLMTGAAPTQELRGVFQRLKEWLTQIYRDVRSLGVELSPEVVDLFDRMLSTENDRMVEVSTIGGLIAESKAVSERLEETTEDVAEIPRVVSAMWDSASLDDKDIPGWAPPDLINGVSDALQLERPELVKAVRKLGGISYQSVVATWGQEEAKRLRDRDMSLFRKNGAKFDTLVSELLHEGVHVEDAQELWDKLMADDPAVDSKLNVAITDETLPWLFYLLGDDEVLHYAQKRGLALNRELKKASASDDHSQLRSRGPEIYKELQLISEIKATLKDAAERKRRPSPDSDAGFSGDAEFSADMFKREGEVKRESVPTGEAAEQAAGFMRDDEMISLREADRAAWRRAQRFSRLAFAAGKREGTSKQKDKVAVLKLKQKEQAAIKKEINGILKGIKKAAADKKMLWKTKLELTEYLKDYTLKRVSQAKQEQAEALRAYLDENPEVAPSEFSSADQKLLATLETTTLNDMTLADLRELSIKVSEIQGRGRAEYARWDAERKQRRDDAFKKLYDEVKSPQEQGAPKTVTGPADLTKQYSGVKGVLEKRKDSLFAYTLGAQRLFDWIGGGVGKFDTAWTRYFVDEVNQCRNVELRHSQARQEKIEKVMSDLGISFRDLNAKRMIDGEELMVDHLLSVYALMQNERGAKALLFGNMKDWADPVAHAANCVKALTEKERVLADAILADYEESFDRLNEVFIDAYNEGMEKEEHYSPMRRLEYSSTQGLLDVTDAEGMEAAGMASGAQRAGLEKGFLHRRVDIGAENQKPVDLGLVSLWNAQVTAQEHTAAYAKLAGDLVSVTMQQHPVEGGTLAGAVKKAHGSAAWRSAASYLNFVIRNDKQIAGDVMAGVASKMGRNMSISYLALNFMSPLKQFTGGLPRFIVSAGPTQLLSATGRWMAHPRAFMQSVYAMDPQIKDRVPNAFFKVYKDNPSRFQDAQGRYTQAMSSLMSLISWADRTVAAIGWQATYEANIKRGLSHDAAVREAQRAVALTQQVPNAKDMPMIWREATGYMKLAMIFSTDSAPAFGMAFYDVAQALKRGDVPQGLMTMMALAVTAVLTGAVSNGLPDDDDNESWAEWLASQLSEQTLSSLPLIGKELFAAWDAIMNDNVRGSAQSALVAPFYKILSGGAAMLSDDSDKVGKDGMTKFERGAWNAVEGLSLYLAPFPVTAARRFARLQYAEDGVDALKTAIGVRRRFKRLGKATSL